MYIYIYIYILVYSVSMYAEPALGRGLRGRKCSTTNIRAKGARQLTHKTVYPLRNHCVIDRSTSCQHVSCGPLTSKFYGLDVMDCNVEPSLAGGFRMPRGAPQGENTKGTFVKGHLCAYLK